MLLDKSVLGQLGHDESPGDGGVQLGDTVTAPFEHASGLDDVVAVFADHSLEYDVPVHQLLSVAHVQHTPVLVHPLVRIRGAMLFLRLGVQSYRLDAECAQGWLRKQVVHYRFTGGVSAVGSLIGVGSGLGQLVGEGVVEKGRGVGFMHFF